MTMQPDHLVVSRDNRGAKYACTTDGCRKLTRSPQMVCIDHRGGGDGVPQVALILPDKIQVLGKTLTPAQATKLADLLVDAAEKAER